MERPPRPTAVILDGRTLRSTPESGQRVGWDGAKRRKGTGAHLAIDALGDLLAVHVTSANVQDRARVAELSAPFQAATGETVAVAYVDAGYTGEEPRQAAAAEGIALEVVKLPALKRGVVLLPRRWVVERDLTWLSRSRRPARDQERLAEVVKGFHPITFIILVWKYALPVLDLL